MDRHAAAQHKLDRPSRPYYVLGMKDRIEDTPVFSRVAKFGIGQVVRHRIHPFRGVIFDVDPEFANTEDWWESIPEDNRPHKDQPFYHLLAENETSYYHAYVSEQNLLPDETGEPVEHPQVHELFGDLDGGQYEVDALNRH